MVKNINKHIKIALAAAAQTHDRVSWMAGASLCPSFFGIINSTIAMPGCFAHEAGFFFFKLINLFMVALGLSSLREGPLQLRQVGASPHRGARGPSPSRPLLLWSTGSRRAGPATVAHGPSRSAARGIPPDQGSNPRPLHWQADSQPPRHQGSPEAGF